MTLDPSFLTVTGREVRYAMVGEGPPLLCFHGYPDTLQLYSRLAPCLAADFEVIAVDWPGLGASDPWPGAATPSARASHIHELLDAFGYESVYLMGTDMGGPPSLIAAARTPDRIRGVVVSNSLLFGDGETSTEIALFRTVPMTNRFGLTYAPRVVFERCLDTFLPSGARLNSGLREDFWQYFRRRSVREHLVAMCADYETELDQLPAMYNDVECPILACWGTADHHFPPSQGHRLVDAVDDGTLTLVEEGHHWMVWNRANRVADAIQNWAEY